MKAINTIVKILAAAAAVAGVVYVIATYGDKIVAWAKNLVGSCKCGCTCTCDGDCTCEESCVCPCACEDDEKEANAESSCTCDVQTSEKDAPVAEEKDFED